MRQNRRLPCLQTITLLYDLNCSCCHARPARSSTCTVVDDTPVMACWAKEWNASFNAAKSTELILTRSQCDQVTCSPLMMGSVVIPRTAVTKHLGVLLTENLSWGCHMNAVIVKVLPKIAAIKWLAFRLHLPGFIISRFYLAAVRPILEYAGPVWCNCRKVDAVMLERIQIRLARAVLFANGQR